MCVFLKDHFSNLCTRHFVEYYMSSLSFKSSWFYTPFVKVSTKSDKTMQIWKNFHNTRKYTKRVTIQLSRWSGIVGARLKHKVQQLLVAIIVLSLWWHCRLWTQKGLQHLRQSAQCLLTVGHKTPHSVRTRFCGRSSSVVCVNSKIKLDDNTMYALRLFIEQTVVPYNFATSY